MKSHECDYFDFFSGSWMSKKSIYLLTHKIESQYQEFIKINKDDQKYNLSYKSSETSSYLYHSKINFEKSTIIQKQNKIIKFYNLNYIYPNLLKIKTKLCKKNLSYKEYIYSINQNLKISISFLKNKNEYLAIVFTSYIKLFK